jgi:hypothetical protein
MTSELRSATSRANGAKSKGPKTAEGREKSSQNSLAHGFTSRKTVVLKCENEGEFQEMLGFYAETYLPGSPVEKDLVHEMVACRWRMERLRLMETALIDSEMDRELPEEETPADHGYQLAFAFRRLVDESRAISLASRYESRLHRIHERSHRTLRELQQTRKEQIAEPVLPAPVQPEPAPDPVAQSPKNDETNPAPLEPGATPTEPRASASDPKVLSIKTSRRCSAIRGYIDYRRRFQYSRRRVTPNRTARRLSYNEYLPQATRCE